MKTKTYKIILFVTIFALIFSLLVIPSFASDFNGVISSGQEIKFAEILDFTFTPSNLTFLFYVINDPDEVPYTSIEYRYSGGDVLYYKSSVALVETKVYDASEGGWVDDIYRNILVEDNVVFSGDNLGFISTNLEQSSNEGLYDALYDLITSSIYGDRDLTSFESNTATILTTIICVILFALPLILVFWLTKFIFTLGRNW